MKNYLINGLSSKHLFEVQGFLDLRAEEIAYKNDLLHIQWEALGLTSVTEAEKVLHMLHEKSVGNDERSIINELEQICGLGFEVLGVEGDLSILISSS